MKDYQIECMEAEEKFHQARLKLLQYTLSRLIRLNKIDFLFLN